MAYVAIASDLHGYIFALDHSGDLYRNRHLTPGTGPLAFPGLGERIGSGWRGIQHFAATRSADRLLLAGVAADGTVHTAQTAVSALDQWDSVVPEPDGEKWHGIARLCAGVGGALYGVTHAGAVEHRAYTSSADPPGNIVLQPNPVQPLGAAWGLGASENRLTLMHTGTRFLDITVDGTLRYQASPIGAADTPNEWVVLSGGWTAYQRVFAGGERHLYAIGSEGGLVVHHFVEERNAVRLLPRERDEEIGTGIIGWATLPSAVEGYATPQCGIPGDTISFHTAARTTITEIVESSNFTVEYVRLRRREEGVVGGYREIIGRDERLHRAELHSIPENWLVTGMMWPATFDLQIPLGTPSGLYAARCIDQYDQPFYIPFVVRPAAKSAPFAVLANTNTWNAYNSWGGQGKYVHQSPPPLHIPFERPHPGLTPLIPASQASSELLHQSNHLLRAELWALGWLDSLGATYAYDLYTDRDLHDGIAGLTDPNPAARYKALILPVHPEYWTAEMYDAAKSYLDMGGTIVYLGGNGIYEEVRFEPNGVGLTIFPGVDWTKIPLKDQTNAKVRKQCLWRVRGKPERALIGVGFEDCPGLTTPGEPYRLALSPDQSPALRGLTLAVGDTLGETSANPGFCADGWEVDKRGLESPPAAAAVTALLALGASAALSGQMLFYETDPNGKKGVVFAGSSLNFCGSLAVDRNLQTIVQNVLDIALQRQSATA